MSSQYKIYNQSEFDQIEKSIIAMSAAWFLEWLEVDDFTLTLSNIFSVKDLLKSEFLSENTEVYWPSANAGIGCILADETKNSLLQAMLAVDKACDVEIAHIASGELVKRILNDLVCESLLKENKIGEFANDIQSVADLELYKGEGWVLAMFQSATVVLPLLMSYEFLHQYLNTAEPAIEQPKSFFSKKQAIRNKKTELIVELGKVELTVGDVQSLEVGDVIRLNRPIQEKIIIKNKQNDFVAFGVLGQQAGFKAVFLSSERI